MAPPMVPIETMVADATARRVSEALLYQTSMTKSDKTATHKLLLNHAILILTFA
jgi:hypothetical protein